MIESILELQPNIAPVAAASTLTTAVGNTAVTGVGFTANVSPDDILYFTDNAGVERSEQVDTVTDDNNLTLFFGAQSVATAVAFRVAAQGTGITTNFFRADNTKTRSRIIGGSSLPLAQQILKGPASLFGSDIDQDEGFLIKSLYIRLPYQYTMAASPWNIELSYLDTSGVFIQTVTSIGEGVGSGFIIPRENEEFEVNVYVPPPSTALGQNYQIAATLEGAGNDVSESTADPTNQLASVSQLDAPDALNGQILPVIIGMRILHASIPLV